MIGWYSVLPSIVFHLVGARPRYTPDLTRQTPSLLDERRRALTTNVSSAQDHCIWGALQ